jgi:hypothetical protein
MTLPFLTNGLLMWNERKKNGLAALPILVSGKPRKNHLKTYEQTFAHKAIESRECSALRACNRIVIVIVSQSINKEFVRKRENELKCKMLNFFFHILHKFSSINS